MNDKSVVRLANRMDQLPPYLFGMINTMKMEKRRYEKPEIKRIRLDAQTAVLTVCKVQGQDGGPTSQACGPPKFQPCELEGS